MKVLVIDPGERCGWTTAEVTWPSPQAVHELASPPSLEVIDHGIATLKDMALATHERLGGYDVLIVEEYRIAPAKLKQHANSDVPTLQMIGMLRMCAWLNPSVRVVMQKPKDQASQAMKVIAANPEVFGDIARRLDGLPKEHDQSHDGSALRHLATWFWRNYL